MFTCKCSPGDSSAARSGASERSFHSNSNHGFPRQLRSPTEPAGRILRTATSEFPWWQGVTGRLRCYGKKSCSRPGRKSTAPQKSSCRARGKRHTASTPPRLSKSRIGLNRSPFCSDCQAAGVVGSLGLVMSDCRIEPACNSSGCQRVYHRAGSRAGGRVARSRVAGVMAVRWRLGGSGRLVGRTRPVPRRGSAARHVRPPRGNVPRGRWRAAPH